MDYRVGLTQSEVNKRIERGEVSPILYAQIFLLFLTVLFFLPWYSSYLQAVGKTLFLA